MAWGLRGEDGGEGGGEVVMRKQGRFEGSEVRDGNLGMWLEDEVLYICDLSA